MLRARVVPTLLISHGGLIKTVRFADPKYVGDPINAVKIFNEKEADELSVFDIDATVNGKEPDFKRIANLAVECRMPLCYGGGITSVDQAKRIIGLGVEKIAVSAAAARDPSIVHAIAKGIGSQSVVVVLDVRREEDGRYGIWTHNGGRSTGRTLEAFLPEIESLGAGEIVVNSIDRDGAMAGYDLELAVRARRLTRLPLTILGGAGSLDDLRNLFEACGVVGAAAGSLFVFKGVYRAVLINYPNRSAKDALLQAAPPSRDPAKASR